jgi:hypothetical protein
MDVIHGSRAAIAWRGGGPDPSAITAFLHQQAMWLQRGLAQPDDDVAVGLALAAHDGAHEAWLCLIALLGEHSCAGRLVGGLYDLHGRAAGSLERGMVERLPTDVGSTVRSGMIREISARTSQAVAALERRKPPSSTSEAPA